MSACQFDFSLPAEVSSLLEGLRADFARFGGTVSGDGEPGFGEFSLPTPLGTFSGTYEVSSDTPGVCAVHIEVDEKPMFVPCAAIEEHLGRRLSKAAAR
ncbi:MAG: hypothetical protein OXI45_07985 [Acidobacteriota bacterium]|nr:hypothetical protein [Acidobacteriota bacterium]